MAPTLHLVAGAETHGCAPLHFLQNVPSPSTARSFLRCSKRHLPAAQDGAPKLRGVVGLKTTLSPSSLALQLAAQGISHQVRAARTRLRGLGGTAWASSTRTSSQWVPRQERVTAL